MRFLDAMAMLMIPLAVISLPRMAEPTFGIVLPTIIESILALAALLVVIWKCVGDDKQKKIIMERAADDLA